MHFLKFFIKYLFQAKTRQGLLIMAMAGLFVSSFCLVLVQGVLTGLQGNRVERSKEIEGSYVVKLSDSSTLLEKFLSDQEIKFSKEYQLEGLVKNGNYITPVIIHGLAPNSHVADFLKDNDFKSKILMSAYVAQKAMMRPGDEIQIISPAHTDVFFGDLPRYKTLEVAEFVDSKDPAIDEFHVWTDLRSVQSLIRKKAVNQIRIYQRLDSALLTKVLGHENVREIIKWESSHQNLVYALSLENNVILFLFSATVVLVGLSIVAGLSIFFNRLKQDFVSFWILGMSLQRIKRVGAINIGLVTVSTLVLGNLLGLAGAYLLESFSPVIMPEMFVDRSLPVKITLHSFNFSFLFPVILTIIFTYIASTRFFNSKNDFLKTLRSIGR